VPSHDSPVDDCGARFEPATVEDLFPEALSGGFFTLSLSLLLFSLISFVSVISIVAAEWKEFEGKDVAYGLS